MTGAHWLDDPPDPSCQDSTRRHPVDDPLLSCKQQVGGSSSPASSHQPSGTLAGVPSVDGGWSGDDGEGVAGFGLTDLDDPGLAVGGAVGAGAAGDGQGDRLAAGLGQGGQALRGQLALGQRQGPCWRPATRSMRSTRRWSATTAAGMAAVGPSPTAGMPRSWPIWSAPTGTTTGNTPAVEAVKVLARAHQSLIWARQRHVNALRSALRDFYPEALSALGTQLAAPEALAVLGLAPTPEQGRRLTRAAVRRALVGAGRRRNLQARVMTVHAALAAPQLAAPGQSRRPTVRWSAPWWPCWAT